jgi:GTP-binding protein
MSFTVRDCQFMTSAVKPAHYPAPGPPEVAFAGRSNVGKSSMLRTLLARKKMVRVSSRPGCTQQINFFSLNQDAIRLVDLPGYGFAQVPLAVKAEWGKMIEGYLTGRPELKAVVVILDIRRDPSGDDLALLNWLQSHAIPILVAVTKADKLSRNQAFSRLAKLRPQLTPYDPEPVAFSAETGQGRDALWQRVLQMAGMEK